MPDRSTHVREAQKLGIPERTADRVARLKDRPSQSLPGYAHWGFNHGVGTNIKYLCIDGVSGYLASLHHNLLDRLHFAIKTKRRALATSTTFFLARFLTWYPSKMVSNLLVPDPHPPSNLRRRIRIINTIYTLIYGKT